MMVTPTKTEKLSKSLMGMELGTESEGVFRYVLPREDISKILQACKEAGLKFVNPFIVAEHPNTIEEIENG